MNSPATWSRLAAPAVLALMFATAGAGAVSGPAAYADDDGQRHRVFRINSMEITESSSLFVSTAHPGLVYTTNDSGDTPTIYVLDADNGALVGRTTLSGVDAVDVEALAGGTDGLLVMADIGDNDSVRDSVSVYRLPQPESGRRTASAERVELAYVDGPRDAESALYDARTGRIFVVSKELAGASVYVTPRNVFDRSRALLRRVAGAPALATDATLLPGAKGAVVRTYVGATIYSFPSFEPVGAMPLPRLEQGESIAAPPSGAVVWVGSEGVRSPVIAVRLPKPSPTTPTTPTTSPTTPTTPTTSPTTPIAPPTTPTTSPATPTTSPIAPPTTARAPTGEDAAGTPETPRGVAEKVLVGSAVGLVLVVAFVGVLAWSRRGRLRSR